PGTARGRRPAAMPPREGPPAARGRMSRPWLAPATPGMAPGPPAGATAPSRRPNAGRPAGGSLSGPGHRAATARTRRPPPARPPRVSTEAPRRAVRSGRSQAGTRLVGGESSGIGRSQAGQRQQVLGLWTLDQLRGLLRLGGAKPERRAVAGQRADPACRPPGMAHAPAVKDHPVRQHRPVTLGHEGTYRVLDLDRVLLLGPPPA